MSDIEASIVNQSINLENLQPEDVILIIINPIEIPEGTVLYNKTVPEGKKMNGNVTIYGALSDIE
jgi:hypothetical protein